jgi:hypothetical protein
MGILVALGVIGAVNDHSKTGNASSATPAVSISSKAPITALSPSPKASPAASRKPNPSASAKECDPGPDIIVWYRVPTINDSAQRLGSRGGADCSSTFDSIRTTSPTGDGYCTEAAWASDNPGYNADADPAAPLQHVVVSVGPACDSLAGGSSGGGSSGGSSSGGSTAPILSPSGNYYRAGEFCPHDDDGLSTVDANGNTITCSQVNGYFRWHY